MSIGTSLRSFGFQGLCLLSVLLLAISCHSGVSPYGPPQPPPAKSTKTNLAPSDLADVNAEIAIGESTYTATADMWFDMMPSDGRKDNSGPALAGSILLLSGTSPKGKFAPVDVLVIIDDEVWKWPIYNQDPYRPNSVMAFYGGLSPNLKAGNAYDLIVEFSDSAGAIYRIRVDDVKIEEAY